MSIYHLPIRHDGINGVNGMFNQYYCVAELNLISEIQYPEMSFELIPDRDTKRYCTGLIKMLTIGSYETLIVSLVKNFFMVSNSSRVFWFFYNTCLVITKWLDLPSSSSCPPVLGPKIVGTWQ